MENKTNEISAYLENLSLLILGIVLLAFPLIFTISTTDAFALPKQIILGGGVLISLILFGARMISDKSVRLRRTPFDLPVVLFTFITLVSSIIAVNRFDSIAGFVPMLFAIVAYFIIVNTVKNKSSISFLATTLVTGAGIVALIFVLENFGIYAIPYQMTHFAGFNTFGSILDQAIYLILILPVAAYFALPLLKIKDFKEVKGKEIGFAIGAVVILAGFGFSVFQLMTTQKPLVLPFETGFQTAFAAISQDTGRVAQGFFLGSGFGTYFTDFTRFKQATFNTNQTLWAMTFYKSSSFLLELLATTGILGLMSFVFLIFKVVKDNHFTKKLKDNAFFLSLVLTFVASIILPFTFTTLTLLFVLLALYAALQALENIHTKDSKFFDIELHFVAFKKGIIPLSLSPVEERETAKTFTKILPVTFFILIFIFVGIIGYFVTTYVISDVTFQNSLVAASANNGLETYNDQVNAKKIFPYRDAYYRIFSQTNLALANSLAAQQKGSSISAQTQQTIYTLIQQAIDSARTAVDTSPQNVANWQNLSSVYRSLIGFGQNAEQFSVLTNQQAILLDPNNPQEYISLGGIYFQLGQWDNAQRQFQIAINLKPDYANAYYNLGHALENKGDMQNALAAYQAVQTLVANDKPNLDRINQEINTLKTKIGNAEAQNGQTGQQEAASTTNTPNQENKKPLEVSTPSAQLPEQNPPVKIPGPSAKPTVTPTPSQAVEPSPTVQP